MSFNVFRVISFFLLLLAQVLLFKNVVLFHTAFCFLYLLFLLTLPVESNPLVLMLIAFVMGLGVDIFYDSVGLHAMACVVMMYLRSYWLARITPQGGYDRNATPSMALNGVQWFVVYALPLIFVHHVVLFYVEAGGGLYFWFTLLKVIASTIFTLIVMIMAQLLFWK